MAHELDHVCAKTDGINPLGLSSGHDTCAVDAKMRLANKTWRRKVVRKCGVRRPATSVLNAERALASLGIDIAPQVTVEAVIAANKQATTCLDSHEREGKCSAIHEVKGVDISSHEDIAELEEVRDDRPDTQRLVRHLDRDCDCIVAVWSEEHRSVHYWHNEHRHRMPLLKCAHAEQRRAVRLELAVQVEGRRASVATELHAAFHLNCVHRQTLVGFLEKVDS
jgi:hypothetical protein